MKNRLSLVALILSFFLLQGCAGGLIVIAGATVAVSSDERSITTQFADDNLALQALDKITEMPINHRDVRINLIVNNGYLLMIGQVTDEAQKAQVEAQLSSLDGIKEIYNQLRINKPIGLTQQTKDSWITTKAKSILTAHDDINPFHIKVVTEDSELFLIGRVNAKTADTATNLTREIAGVKRVNRVLQIIEEK